MPAEELARENARDEDAQLFIDWAASRPRPFRSPEPRRVRHGPAIRRSHARGVQGEVGQRPLRPAVPSVEVEPPVAVEAGEPDDVVGKGLAIADVAARGVELLEVPDGRHHARLVAAPDRLPHRDPPLADVTVRVRLSGGLLLLWAVTPVIVQVRRVRGFSRIEGEYAVRAPGNPRFCRRRW